MSIRITAVTPVHNRREDTLRCLRSLRRIDRTGFVLDIIVVDDNSTDGTAEAIASEFPEVQIVSGNGSLFYTAGTNVGFKEALKRNPDYILAFNDDSIFDENCVRRLVECAEKHSRSVVGAALHLWNQPHKVFQTAPIWKTWLGGWRHWYQQTVWTIPQKPFSVDLIVGNCILYPVEAIEKVGLMDEKFIQYGDVEYTSRLRRNNWKLIIEPRARVFCKPNDRREHLRQMPLKKSFKTLFTNNSSGHNLIHRFYSRIESAPNRLSGIAAFIIFHIRWLIKRNYESNFALQQEEPPLKETFQKRVLID